MSAQKRNGPDAANDRPAKLITKRTSDFIAHCYQFASCFTLDRCVTGDTILLAATAVAMVAMIFGGAL